MVVMAVATLQLLQINSNQMAIIIKLILLKHVFPATTLSTRGGMIPTLDPDRSQILCFFQPQIWTQSQIFSLFSIQDPDSDPVKSGIVTPLLSTLLPISVPCHLLVLAVQCPNVCLPLQRARATLLSLASEKFWRHSGWALIFHSLGGKIRLWPRGRTHT